MTTKCSLNWLTGMMDVSIVFIILTFSPRHGVLKSWRHQNLKIDFWWRHTWYYGCVWLIPILKTVDSEFVFDWLLNSENGRFGRFGRPSNLLAKKVEGLADFSEILLFINPDNEAKLLSCKFFNMADDMAEYTSLWRIQNLPFSRILCLIGKYFSISGKSIVVRIRKVWNYQSNTPYFTSNISLNFFSRVHCCWGRGC